MSEITYTFNKGKPMTFLKASEMLLFKATEGYESHIVENKQIETALDASNECHEGTDCVIKIWRDQCGLLHMEDVTDEVALAFYKHQKFDYEELSALNADFDTKHRSSGYGLWFDNSQSVVDAAYYDYEEACRDQRDDERYGTYEEQHALRASDVL